MGHGTIQATQGGAPDKTVGREVHIKEKGGMGHSMSILKIYMQKGEEII